MEIPALDSSSLNADELVGLLSDPNRFRVVSALALGASTFDEIRAASGLELRAVTRSLTRLADSGLVVVESDAGADARHYLVESAFRIAARRAAATRPSASEHEDAPADEAKVLRAFVREGRLTSIPSTEKKRLIVLEWLAPNFDPGRRYSEQMVNLILGKFHADTAALRRYLVDYGFLSREAGEYWRSGGRVEV
jgi:DNA-binding transcriptional ArsR family regulator